MDDYLERPPPFITRLATSLTMGNRGTAHVCQTVAYTAVGVMALGN